MSGKHFKAHEVSCCIKYFIFGFNIIFWVSPLSAVRDFRPAIVSLTRSLFPISSCEVHLCVRMCLLWCLLFSWVSIRFHFLFCSCALAPCHPSARFVFVCPPSEWEQLSLSASSRVYMTVAFSWGLFFFSFFVVMFRLRKQPSPFLCMSETAGEKNPNIPSFKPTVTVGRQFLAWNNNLHGCFFTGCWWGKVG